jgi:hypothetical protein
LKSISSKPNIHFRYLIHNLRLTYLRHVEDPFGSRIISVNPNYTSNAYIVASGLADNERWPELNSSLDPSLEEDELSSWSQQANSRDTHSAAGFPAANGLKYARTIRPNTRESANLRTRRSRAQSQRDMDNPLPPIPSDHSPTQRNRSDSAPDPVTNGSHPQAFSNPSILSEKRRSISGFASGSPAPVEPSVQPVPFKPPFARAAEMERQRKARMRRRARQAKVDAGLPLSRSDEESSSESETLSADSDFEEQDET